MYLKIWGAKLFAKRKKKKARRYFINIPFFFLNPSFVAFLRFIIIIMTFFLFILFFLFLFFFFFFILEPSRSECENVI